MSSLLNGLFTGSLVSGGDSGPAPVSVRFGASTRAGRGGFAVTGTSIPPASGLTVTAGIVAPTSNGSAVPGTYTLDDGSVLSVAVEANTATVRPEDGSAEIMALLDAHNASDPMGVTPFTIRMRPGNYGSLVFNDHIPKRAVNIQLKSDLVADARKREGAALDQLARISSAHLRRTGAVEAEDVGSLTFTGIYFHDVATTEGEELVWLLCSDVKFDRCLFDHGQIAYVDGGAYIGENIACINSSWTQDLILDNCEFRNAVTPILAAVVLACMRGCRSTETDRW